MQSSGALRQELYLNPSCRKHLSARHKNWDKDQIYHMSATLHLLPAKSSLCLLAPHAVFIIDCYPHLRAGISPDFLLQQLPIKTDSLEEQINRGTRTYYH